jgi:radical SAM-linked protein
VDGELIKVQSLIRGYDKITRAVLPDLDSAKILSPPLVPLNKIVHDRLGLEIARGCTRGCRFCQAGIIYRPVREVTPQKIMALAKSGIEKGGFEEMALLSLSTGDYSCLPELLTSLMNSYAGQNVAISMPSMRVGTLTKEIMEQVKRVRKTGFTIAPEAGSERLRRVINKGITEEDLLETCRAAFDLGWKIIKLYFMCGLPTETQTDLEAIPELLQKALSLAHGGKGRKINASIGVFVPKPHTPFQWEAQLSIEEGYERIYYLNKRMPKGAELKWNDPRLSFLEGVFSRGDRKLSGVIEEAWRRGARFDGWSEHFNLSLWEEAADACGVELGHYLRRRKMDEALPWEHLSAGLDDVFFKDELEKAKQEVYTPDCRVNGCQKCGLCDFKEIRPICHGKEGSDSFSSAHGETGNNATLPVDNRGARQDHFFYKVVYQRTGNARFLGHLELLQAIFRAIRRGKLPINFSQGFHPTPKVSFGPALPVGTESLAEYFVADLSDSLTDVEGWVKRLNCEMPEDILITKIILTSGRMPLKVVTDYRIQLPGKISAQVIHDFMQADEYCISLSRKKKVRKINIRPCVHQFAAEADGIHLSLESAPGKTVCKPTELMQSLFKLTDQEVLQAKIMKTGFQELA